MNVETVHYVLLHPLMFLELHSYDAARTQIMPGNDESYHKVQKHSNEAFMNNDDDISQTVPIAITFQNF